MGMDEQSGSLLEKGVEMAQGFMERGAGNDARAEGARLAESRAGLAEQDAAADTSLARQRAKGDAADFRDRAERERAGTQAAWGASNLAMSGSKKLVRDGAKRRDRQAEEDLLFEGDQEARRLMNQGRNRANMLRIDGGGRATRSTLALGSKLYQYGG